MTKRERIEELKADLLKNLEMRISAIEQRLWTLPPGIEGTNSLQGKAIIEQLAALEAEVGDD